MEDFNSLLVIYLVTNFIKNKLNVKSINPHTTI